MSLRAMLREGDTRRVVLGTCCVVAGGFIAAVPGATSGPSWSSANEAASGTVLGAILITAGVLLFLKWRQAQIVGAGICTGAHTFLAVMFLRYAVGHDWLGVIGATETGTVAGASLLLLFALTVAMRQTRGG